MSAPEPQAAGDPTAGDVAVILDRDSPKPDAEIGRLIAYHLGLHPTDAIARVRYGGGLLVEGVSEETAQSLVERLRGIGVRARPVSSGLWSYVPRGARAFALELLDDAIVVRMVSGRSVEVPRREIFAVNVYGLLPEARKPPPDKGRKGKKSAEEDALGAASASLAAWSHAGSLRPRGQKLHDRLVEAGLQRLELHLVVYAESFGPVRVQKNDFDFTCLGPDRAEHSLDNFLVLLERILAYVPDAWNRERAEKFLEDLNPKPVHIFKPEEAENLERWLYEHSRIALAERAEAEGEP